MTTWGVWKFSQDTKRIWLNLECEKGRKFHGYGDQTLDVMQPTRRGHSKQLALTGEMTKKKKKTLGQ